MVKITIITIVISIPLFGATADASSRQCLAGMRGALIAGHFTGPLVCEKKNATFNLVGRTAGRKYAIYDYRYRYMPENGNVMHGGQKVVIFLDNKYIGQYALSPPPYIAVMIRGQKVVLKVDSTKEIVKLDFSKSPPKKVFINGEMEYLYR